MKWPHFLSRLAQAVSAKMIDHSVNRGSKGITSYIRKDFDNACPICRDKFVDHSFTLLAVTSSDETDRVNHLLNNVKAHRWADAFQIKEFDASRDATIVYVLSCPSNKLAMVIMSDPYDPYDVTFVFDHEVLDHETSEDLRSVLKDEKWRPMDPQHVGRFTSHVYRLPRSRTMS